jgi:hypothetical protein
MQQFTIEGARNSIAVDMAFAERHMQRKGELSPIFVLRTSREMVTIPKGWNSTQEQTTVRSLVRLLAIAYNARQVSMLSEAWASTNTAILPRNDPNRTEIVSVMTACRDDAGNVFSLAEQRQIVRDKAGRFAGLKADLPLPDDAKFRSWISGTVPPHDMAADIQKEARRLITQVGFKPEIIARFEMEWKQ